jgi:hypothetical protein
MQMRSSRQRTVFLCSPDDLGSGGSDFNYHRAATVAAQPKALHHRRTFSATDWVWHFVRPGFKQEQFALVEIPKTRTAGGVGTIVEHPILHRLSGTRKSRSSILEKTNSRDITSVPLNTSTGACDRLTG